MRIAWYLTLLLASAAPSHAAPDCVVSRLVAIGDGCIELPCDYRATSRWLIDIGGGYLESRTKMSRIEWVSGQITYPLGIEAEGRVVWRWPAVHGWRFWWHALIETKGRRFYRVANYSLILEVPATTPDALSQLEAIAASYTRRATPAECELPEHEPWRLPD